jgi:sugar lactone lactonase YvrE
MSIVSRYIARSVVPAVLLGALLSACGAPTQSAVTPQPATSPATSAPAATIVPAATDAPTAAPTSLPQATVAPQVTTAPQATAAPPTAQPTTVPVAEAELLYIDQGALFSQSATGGQPRQLAAIQGTFLGAVVADDAVLVLLEDGIARIQLSDRTSERVVTFEAKAQGGSRLLAADNYVFYAARFDEGDAPFGKTRVGYYNRTDGSTKQLLIVDGAAEPLGLTAQKDGLYLLPRGQDPAFGTVRVVDLASGQVSAELMVEGEGQAVLSPDGRVLAATARRFTTGDANDPGQDLIQLYDMTADPPTRQEIVPPQAPSAANSLFWSPDSRTLYFALGRGTIYELTESYGLWRLDIASGQAAQVSDADLRNSWIDWISTDGTRAVVAHPQEVAPEVLDLTTGSVEPLAVPGTAFLVGWR